MLDWFYNKRTHKVNDIFNAFLYIITKQWWVCVANDWKCARCDFKFKLDAHVSVSILSQKLANLNFLELCF